MSFEKWMHRLLIQWMMGFEKLMPRLMLQSRMFENWTRRVPIQLWM
jgi:hypothetical protein